MLRECTHLTPEIALKWDAIQRRPDHFNFDSMDGLLAFAVEQGMKVHGHTLLWHGSTPRWVRQELLDNKSWGTVQRYFQAVLSRYRGHIHQWDVINEPIETGYRMDGLRRNAFLEAFGPGYIPQALWEARRLAPQATLMINEFGLEYDVPLERDRRYLFLKLLEGLKHAGVPLDGVGLQSHLSHGPFSASVFGQFMREIADLGLFIVISELDVKEYEYVLPADQRDRIVADETRRYLDVALANPAVRGVMTWGLSDRHSWLKVEPEDFARYPDAWKDGSSPGFNRGLPFDASMRRKPMYWAIADALRGRT